MEIMQSSIKGVFEIKLKPHYDQRGFLMRTYDKILFKEFGIESEWVQENHSANIKQHTIRGLHFCLSPHTEIKLISCIKGRILDVFVDLRKGSLSFGKWSSVELSEGDYKHLFLPKGIAHGFCTLEDNSELLYKHDNYYAKEFDSGILWNDKHLEINWPTDDPIISEKDQNLMTWNDFLQNIGGL